MIGLLIAWLYTNPMISGTLRKIWAVIQVGGAKLTVISVLG